MQRFFDQSSHLSGKIAVLHLSQFNIGKTKGKDFALFTARIIEHQCHTLCPGQFDNLVNNETR